MPEQGSLSSRTRDLHDAGTKVATASLQKAYHSQLSSPVSSDRLSAVLQNEKHSTRIIPQETSHDVSCFSSIAIFSRRSKLTASAFVRPEMRADHLLVRVMTVKLISVLCRSRGRRLSAARAGKQEPEAGQKYRGPAPHQIQKIVSPAMVHQLFLV